PPAGWQGRVVATVPSTDVRPDDPGHTYHVLDDGTGVATTQPSKLPPDVAQDAGAKAGKTGSKTDPALLATVTDSFIAVGGTPVPLAITPTGTVTAAGGAVPATSDSAKPKQESDELEQKVKKFLEAKTDPERQSLLVAIRKRMKVLRDEMEKARGEKEPITQLRVSFEKHIGAKAFAGDAGFKGADAAVSMMASSALRMVVNSRGPLVAAGEGIDVVLKKLEADPDLKKEIQGIGHITTKGFAGSAGLAFDKVTDALLNGSVTEKAVHLINFGDEFLKKNLIARTTDVLNQVKANLAQLGSPTDIEAKIQAVHDAKLNPVPNPKAQEKREKEASKGLFSEQEFQDVVNDNGPMDFKTPSVPLEALDRSALFNLARQKGVTVSREMTNEELLAEIETAAADPARAAAVASGDKSKKIEPTSNADQMVGHETGLTREAMPYVEGIRANMVNPDHDWIKNAVDANMPLKAGISGTTHRFLGVGELLGCKDRPGMRLAMLGHLQAIEAHSFWEICNAVGMGPAIGKYVPFEPVSDSAMEQAARETLHADNAFAKVATGEKDRASQVKRLLGTDKE
nr:hypothetical protein [Deltaproteobacteria bacterium]